MILLWPIDPWRGGLPTRLFFGPREAAPPGFPVRRPLLAGEADWLVEVPERSVTEIRCENFVETLTQADALRWLIECRRALVPGGILRVATPDLAATVARWGEAVHVADDADDSPRAWLDNRCEELNLVMREGGRRWLFDEAELARLADLAGLARGRRTGGVDPSSLEMEFIKPDRSLAAGASPLVSILIPAYGPRYFGEALDSALAQTHPNLEIVIGDDSAGDAIETLARARGASDRRIRYHRNAERLGGRANLVGCLARAHGEFVKCLNDDDVLHPECVARMLDCFRREPDLTLVTSRRQRIDENGGALPQILATTAPVPEDSVMDGLSLGCALVTTRVNFVGEPSTTLFRRDEVARVVPDFMSVDRRRIRGVMDMAAWLNLSTRGDAVYLVDALSSFRVHADQQQQRDVAQIVQWFHRSMGVIEGAWTRLGLVRAAPPNTLRTRPLGSRGAPWQEREAVRR